jgi:hypothetical protein
MDVCNFSGISVFSYRFGKKIMSRFWLESQFVQMGEVNEDIIPSFPGFINGLANLSLIVAKRNNQRWLRAASEYTDAKGTNEEGEKKVALVKKITEVFASNSLAVEVQRILREFKKQIANIDVEENENN